MTGTVSQAGQIPSAFSSQIHRVEAFRPVDAQMAVRHSLALAGQLEILLLEEPA
jgi:hypothetical protein